MDLDINIEGDEDIDLPAAGGEAPAADDYDEDIDDDLGLDDLDFQDLGSILGGDEEEDAPADGAAEDFFADDLSEPLFADDDPEDE